MLNTYFMQLKATGIHYQKGAKANNAQEREKDRAAKGKEGGYWEDVGEGRADEGGGRENREEA
jgi:hypothetical protein